MKKYTLKPGKHQFAPGGQAIHSNDNLTDAEAEWYLARYPHIKSLFYDNTLAERQNQQNSNSRKKLKSRTRNPKPTYEDLPAPN